ncbi:CGNR zinc finger domain-containing protein [Kribbella sp. NBC_00382]|uniref:CGNR zinc finger domain-containing protein n=1 Tax=Kribbella sp. NBC_00382 TaxID=2975967 RepID=UPI003FA60429
MGPLAFEIAATIRHDGQGGVADGLATVELAEAWVQANASLVGEVLGRSFDASLLVVDDGVREQLVGVRRAVRSLFARAVSPALPSKADASRLLDPAAALRRLNEAADKLGTAHLDWPEEGEPVTRWSPESSDPLDLLVGAIGRSGIDFLAGPERLRLRACPAARCVKYFLQDDPRQTWCSPSCGNRERVNRHYQRKHAGQALASDL